MPNYLNAELLAKLEEFTKRSFVPVDQSGGMGGGGGAMPPGMPPGMSPEMMMGGGMPGGMPPGMPPDMSMMGGGMGGSGGMGGGDPVLQQILQKLETLGGGAAAGAGAAQGVKPKIDVNTTLLRIEKMQARILDALHAIGNALQVPLQPLSAAEMVASPEDLQALAQRSQQTATPQGQQGPPSVGDFFPPPEPIGGKQGSDFLDPGISTSAADIFSGEAFSQLTEKADAISLLSGWYGGK